MLLEIHGYRTFGQLSTGLPKSFFVLINTGTCYRDYLYRIFNFRGFSGMVSCSNLTLVHFGSCSQELIQTSVCVFVAYSWYITCTRTLYYCTCTGNCLLDSLRLRALQGRMHSNVRCRSGTVRQTVRHGRLYGTFSAPLPPGRMSSVILPADQF